MAHDNRWRDERYDRPADERRRYERDYADLMHERDRSRGDFPYSSFGTPFGAGYGYWESDWNHGGNTRDRDRDEGRPGSRRHEDRGFMEKAGDEVASWFGDDEAAHRRNQDAQHRGRGPRSYSRTDERITEDVNDRLTDDPYVDASDISVTVRDGEVTLDGTVENRYAKRRSEDIAERVGGVKHVQNNLRYRQVSASSAAASAISGLGNTTTEAPKTADPASTGSGFRR
jgi:hypothetical protein